MQVRKGGSRRVLARPGALTAVLRQAWLSSVWKKDREDDRHHAMDALVVACMDESMLQRLTRAWQHLGENGLYKRTPEMDPPWPDFVDQAMTAWRAGENGGWHVCRTETRRVRAQVMPRLSGGGERPRTGTCSLNAGKFTTKSSPKTN